MTDSEAEAFWKEQYARRKRKLLSDGSIVYECRCGRTIARVVEHDGRKKLKIALVGARSPYDHTFNLGGKCSNTRCNLGHHFDLMEVSTALGHDSYETLKAAEGFANTEQDPRIELNWYYHFDHYVILRTDGTHCMKGGGIFGGYSDGPSDYKGVDIS